MNRPPFLSARPSDDATENEGIVSPVGTGYAHAKFILIGEHAVVHARPAIGIPVHRLLVRADARIVPGLLRLEAGNYSGPLDSAPRNLDSLGAAIRNALAHCGHPERGVAVRVTNNIPVGRGLGASAAVANAIVDSIAELLGTELSEDERFAIVQSAERVAHGNPSGLDARATRESGPILFENGAITRLDAAFGGMFVIADTGIRGSTKVAVDDVGAFLREDPERGTALLDELEQLTRDAAIDLTSNRHELLGERMSHAHAILTELGAGHRSLDTLVRAAMNAGALGAKLTGGGQGGCIVALVRTADEAKNLVETLRAVGATNCWISTLGGHAA